MLRFLGRRPNWALGVLPHEVVELRFRRWLRCLVVIPSVLRIFRYFPIVVILLSFVEFRPIV